MTDSENVTVRFAASTRCYPLVIVRYANGFTAEARRDAEKPHGGHTCYSIRRRAALAGVSKRQAVFFPQSSASPRTSAVKQLIELYREILLRALRISSAAPIPFPPSSITVRTARSASGAA